MRKCKSCGAERACIVSGQGNYEDGRRYGVFVCIHCGDQTRRVLRRGGQEVWAINKPYRDWKRSQRDRR